MGPAGQVSCTAGCAWWFESDLIPAQSPMMSTTRMIHPIPIHRFPGCLGGHVRMVTGSRRSLRQALREQVNEAPDGAGTHNENGPGELGQEMGSIGFPQVQQAEDIEDNHEQDAEQDRNQHDRGGKSFHIPNVTPPAADWVMPILPTPGARHHPATYALRGCSRALLAGSKPTLASCSQVAAGRSLAIDGCSRTSRGHGSAMRRRFSVERRYRTTFRFFRPNIFQLAQIVRVFIRGRWWLLFACGCCFAVTVAVSRWSCSHSAVSRPTTA